MVRALIPCLALVLCLAPAARPADELSSGEKTATRKLEKELIDLARFAAKGKDLEAARAELRLGLAVLPDSTKLRQELEKQDKATVRGQPKPDFAAKLEQKRAEAHREVALALADCVQATESSAPARSQRWLELIQTRFPDPQALERLHLVWFQPYRRWVSQSEGTLLEAGGELLDGQRLDAAAVRALDERHATWSDPWVVSDEVHEVRTTLPLRTARQLLAFVGAYRSYFLQRFGGLWDLRAPEGKLPLIVTRTQQELRERLAAETSRLGGGAPPAIQGAAFYLQSTGRLNPCFVTYQPVDAAGTLMQLTRFEELSIPLVHEVTHQLAFEYSKHEADATRQIQHHFWSVEAIANFMGYHTLERDGWRLTRPRTIPMGQAMIEGPFSWCRDHQGSLPALTRFMGLSQQEFLTVENYHIAATLAWFLLEGEGGKYRAGFVRLLQEVHRVHDGRDLFERSFPGVDQGAMQAEWLRFVRGIELDA